MKNIISINKFQSNILPYLSNHRKILLLLSGGVDSIVLLDLLIKLKDKSNFNLYLFHCNYNFQSNSKIAENLCINIAKSKKIHIYVKYPNLKTKNFEHNARKYRYKTALSIANKHSIRLILTAHHFDDQIETLYMQSLNNSDWICRLGIRKKYGIIFRPLLDVNKKSIYTYAKKYNLSWIDDSSNQDTSFLRNKIRNVIIPQIKKKSPQVIKNLVSEYKYNLNMYNLLKTKLINRLENFILENNHNYLIINNNIVCIKKITEFKFIYQLIFNKYFSLSVKLTKFHWQSFFDFLNKSRIGSKFHIDNNLSILMDRKHHIIYLNTYYDYIKMNRNKKVKINNDKKTILWYNGALKLNDTFDMHNNDMKTIFLDSKIINKGIYIRHWLDGDLCYSNYYKKNIKVSNIFINNKISILDKHVYPIIVNHNDEILFIPDLYKNIINFDKHGSKTCLSWEKRYVE